jgi:polyisoprenoid-binding protein YceI
MFRFGDFRFSVVVVLFVLLGILQGQAQQYNWDAKKADIRFFIKNAGLTVEGTFEQLTGTFVTEGNQHLPVLVIGLARVKSIQTGIGLRDSHLQGKDYFDADNFPEIRMQLLGIQGKLAKFSISIRGISKVYEMPFFWQQIGDKGQFVVEFKLNRRDFDVGGKSLLLSDEVLVKIKLDLRLVAQ